MSSTGSPTQRFSPNDTQKKNFDTVLTPTGGKWLLEDDIEQGLHKGPAGNAQTDIKPGHLGMMNLVQREHQNC